jgi:hypothetical protein
VLQLLDGRAGQRRDAGVGEKNPLLRDGEHPVTEFLIGQDVIDAEVDLISVFLHGKKGKS